MASVELPLLTRVEGHVECIVNIKGKDIVDVRLNPVEGARLFEGWLRGRRYHEVVRFVCRICGFCPTSHNLASIKAVEKCLDLEPSEQTVKLRKLMNFGEVLQSHCVHLYFLALPDFAGGESAFTLLENYPDELKRAVKFREYANLIVEIIGGRMIHPLSSTVNGFSKLPSRIQLEEMLSRLKTMKNDAVMTVEFFSKLPIPTLERKTEYVALQSSKEYALYDGYLASSEGLKTHIEEYKSHIKETIKDYGTSKFSTINGHGYMVGALARVNLNFKQLSEDARKAAEANGLKFPSYNPFYNNLAQAVEMVHFIDEATRLLEELLSEGLREEKNQFKLKAGRGTGSVEAPRGTLFHSYRIDGDGVVRDVDIITPTAQCLTNIEEDMKAILPSLLYLSKREITEKTEFLVRSYDPCISCSVHITQL